MRFLLLLPFASLLPAQSWTQWAGNAQHTSAVRVAAQPASRLLASTVHDPFSRLIQAEGGGSLLAHYQPALTDGRDVFLAIKSGVYTSCSPPGTGSPFPCGMQAWNSQIWGMRAHRWVNNQLRARWTAESDWKPVPNTDGGLSGWEPVFHGAITDRFVLMPAAGGDILVLRRSDGRTLRRIQPFGEDIDPNKYVVSPLTIDDSGNVWYNVLQLHPTDPWGVRGADVSNAWLVKVTPDGAPSTLDYKTLIPGAPTTCRGGFSGDQLPFPPSPTAVPPSGPCLSQRPGVNAAPAVAPDGTVYTVTRAHSRIGSRYSYLLAIHPNLTLKWAASLRGHLKDGCGVLLPIGAPGGCRAGTPANGFDPNTNELPAGEVVDLSTSSPTIAPDGSILYGAQTRYNFLRGHLMQFSAAGAFLNAYDFGWDTTPAILEHDGSYSVILKENNYEVGSYCFDFRFCPPQPNGPYYMTRLDANLKPEWKFQNTNTQECSRRDDGSLACRPARPGGFEWCINATVVDVLGNIYANSEDGNLYVLSSAGKEIGRFFLNLAIGAAYTPLSIGYDGKIYTMNDGRLFVVGK